MLMGKSWAAMIFHTLIRSQTSSIIKQESQNRHMRATMNMYMTLPPIYAYIKYI